MIKGRDKGHAYERKIAKEWRKKGHHWAVVMRHNNTMAERWLRTVTSRSESRSRDNEKVDLCFTEPFNVQCKAIEQSINTHKFLSEMPEKGTNLLFHKRNRKGETVTMMKEDFYRLLDFFVTNYSNGFKEIERGTTKGVHKIP